MIDSPRNPRVKRFRSLAQRKYRRQEGCFPLEGLHLVEEALATEARLEEAFTCPERLRSDRAREAHRALQGSGVPCHELTERAFRQLSDTENPQGLAAVARLPEMGLADLALPSPALVLVACAIGDPGNLGTMIRTAAAAGSAAVVCTSGSADVFGPKAARATQGAIFRVAVVQDVAEDELVRWARSQSLSLVAAASEAEEAYFHGVYAERTALLVGNETQGVPPALLDAADRRVRIPMADGVESLNAAIAAAVLMFEVARRRHAPDD
jgi:TrmH family RNA methyltransferase